MRLWVTRPEDDAGDLAETLRQHGHDAVVEPLLRVTYTPGPPPSTDGVQALLATSANGIRAFARRSAERNLPVLAVGDATARAARNLGFTTVDSAGGDVAALADLVRRRLDPATGPLLHVAGSEVAGDLAGNLDLSGFRYRREILYAVDTPDRLSDAFARDLREGRIDGVLVFSPRTGRTLVRLMQEGGLAASGAHMACFALSRAVAVGVAPLSWRAVVIAARPTQSSLVKAVLAFHPKPEMSLASAASMGYLPVNDSARGAGVHTGDGGMSSDIKSESVPEASTEASAQLGVPPSGDAAARPAAADPSGVSPAPWDRTDEAASPSEGSDDGEAVATDPDGEPAAPVPARTGTGKAVLAAVLAALLIGGGAYAYFSLSQGGGAGSESAEADHAAAPADPMAELSASLEQLETAQARLSKQVSALGPRVDQLERTLATLQKTVDSFNAGGAGAVAGVPSELSERIARLEREAANTASLALQVRSLEATTEIARDTASRLSATVLAVGQLAQAVNAGRPFVRELAAIRAMGGDDATIAQAAASLEAYATNGAPALTVLRARFPATAEAIVRAEPAASSQGWTDQVVDRLASLVTIRQTGPGAIAAGGVDGIVAEATMAVNAADLPAAVAALDKLQGPPAQAAANWIEAARAKMAVDQALATLYQASIGRLSQAKG